MQQPRWLEEAWREFGVREAAGGESDPRVLALYRDCGHPEIKSDEVAWCAAFLGAALERAGVRSTRSLLARSYLAWGEALDEGRAGSIAVLTRGSDPGAGHVGFLLGAAGSNVILLGGNQSDAVTVQTFPMSRVLGFRWPIDDERAQPNAYGTEDVFTIALRHVLEMEGGYTDDPYDPGGPTNHGITLKVFAKWRGVAGDATASFKDALKRISPEDVRAIYRERYWHPAMCSKLPAALALMHFDASGNHGVAGASRMLQQALRVEIDGEIGPETIAAAGRLDVIAVIDRYAEIRRARYRALPHFWRFGRGWLRRVEATLAAARVLATGAAGGGQKHNPQGQSGDTRMRNESDIPVKWWGHSVTIWGAIVSALAAVMPVLGPVLGIDISGEMVRLAGEQMAASVQAIMALAGTLMTIFGRVRAREQLVRRDVSIRL